MIMKWKAFIAIITAVLFFANAEPPGARLTLTSKALKYVSSLIVPLLEKELSVLHIQDMFDESKIKLIGKVQYTVSNIRFESFSITSSTVSSSAAGITLQLSNIAMKCKCDWKYKQKKWPRISDHGRAEIKTRIDAIRLTVLITRSADGHPVINVNGCNVDSPHVSIDLHGGASWFYSLFKGKIEDALKKRLAPMLCDNAHSVVKKWNSKIAIYPLRRDIKEFTVTYGLLNDPSFTSDQIQFDLQGAVISSLNSDAEFPLVELPATTSTDKMFHLLLTSKLFATAVTAAIQSGILHRRISPDQLPSDSVLKLSTLYFKSTVPKLFQQFPDLGVALDVRIDEYKDVYLDPAGVHMLLLGELLLQVIQQDDTIFDAFSVKTEVYCTLDVDTLLSTKDQPTIVVEIKELQATLGTLTSSIGDFNTAALEQWLNGMSQLFLMPIINEYGRKGFPVPSVDNLNFISPSVTFEKDCLRISMDIEYS